MAPGRGGSGAGVGAGPVVATLTVEAAAKAAQDDHVALAEIELCCELMIAASDAVEERLSSARIDEVLKVLKVRVG